MKAGDNIMELFIELSEKLAAEAELKWEALHRRSPASGDCLLRKTAFGGSLRSVLAFSDFVSQSCIRYPLMLQDLVQSGDLFRSYPKEAYDARTSAAPAG